MRAHQQTVRFAKSPAQCVFTNQSQTCNLHPNQGKQAEHAFDKLEMNHKPEDSRAPTELTQDS